MKDIDVYLFEPSTKDLKLQYPELEGVEEFIDLDGRALRFVWLCANPTSPLVKREKDKKKRAIEAVPYCYKKTDQTKGLVRDLENLKFSTELNEAIKRMGKFNVSVRLQAKFTNEVIFTNMQNEAMLSKDQAMMLEDPIDRKAWIQSSLLISKELPTLVKQMEDGFGITIREKGSDSIILSNLAEITSAYEKD